MPPQHQENDDVATTIDNAPLTSGGFMTDRGRLLAGLAFILGLAAILGAWGSQLIGGLVPCELCLEQRLAYYWGLPVLALVVILWPRLPRTVRLVGLLVAAAIFVWGTYMATYHAGVEWRFWPGPTACTGLGVDVSFGDLNNINATRVVPCDAVQFQVFGITMAGWNALAQLAIIALLGAAALVTGRRVSSR
jgi:disulfide bond formation protein DsbB